LNARPAEQTAYVGLGSNLSDPRAQVLAAKLALQHLFHSRLTAFSALYRSKPLACPSLPKEPQPDYINAVARLATTLSPRQLLQALQQIENKQGRIRRSQKWGPRTLDLDILLFGMRIITEHDLRIPHPGLTQRAFVLIPLLEVEPALVLPDGTPAASLLTDAMHEELVPIT